MSPKGEIQARVRLTGALVAENSRRRSRSDRPRRKSGWEAGTRTPKELQPSSKPRQPTRIPIRKKANEFGSFPPGAQTTSQPTKLRKLQKSCTQLSTPQTHVTLESLGATGRASTGGSSSSATTTPGPPAGAGPRCHVSPRAASPLKNSGKRARPAEDEVALFRLHRDVERSWTRRDWQ
jgi:hypothetical protein